MQRLQLSFCDKYKQGVTANTLRLAQIQSSHCRIHFFALPISRLFPLDSLLFLPHHIQDFCRLSRGSFAPLCSTFFSMKSINAVNTLPISSRCRAGPRQMELILIVQRSKKIMQRIQRYIVIRDLRQFQLREQSVFCFITFINTNRTTEGAWHSSYFSFP